MTGSSRSNRPTSCSRDPRVSPTACSRSTPSSKESRALHRGDDAGVLCFLEQQLHRPPAFNAEIERVLVHIQIDVPVHDVLAHLLSVLAYERQAGRAMGQRK